MSSASWRRSDDPDVLARVLAELAKHGEELIRVTLDLPVHEFVQVGFDQDGSWIGLRIVRPHEDRPEDAPPKPIDST